MEDKNKITSDDKLPIPSQKVSESGDKNDKKNPAAARAKVNTDVDSGDDVPPSVAGLHTAVDEDITMSDVCAASEAENDSPANDVETAESGANAADCKKDDTDSASDSNTTVISTLTPGNVSLPGTCKDIFMSPNASPVTEAETHNESRLDAGNLAAADEDGSHHAPSSSSNTSSASSTTSSISDDSDDQRSSSSSNNDVDIGSDEERDAERFFASPLMRHFLGRLPNRNQEEPEEEQQAAASDSEPDEEVDDPDVKITDPWKPVSALFNRELGANPRVYQQCNFKRSVGASVALLERLELQYRMEKHEGCVNALSFNSSGTLLASGSDDLKIVIWDWLRSKPYLCYNSGHRSNVFKTKFLPLSGDCHVVSCARDGQIRLSELSSTGVCRATSKLAQHKGSAHSLSLVKDSSHVFHSSGEDAVAYQMDIRERKPIKLCIVKDDDKKVPLYSIDTNPYKSHEFCVAGRSQQIRIYDKRMIPQEDNNDGHVRKFCPHSMLNSSAQAYVTCAVYNYNGTEILGSYNDDDIYLFDNEHSDGADCIKSYSGHRNSATVKGVNFFGPHSEFVVSGSDGSNIFFWDKETTKVINYVHGDHGGVVNVLEPHPFDPIIATSGLDSDVKIWAPTAGEGCKLRGIKEVMKRNKRERRLDLSNDDSTDSQIWWMIMQHLRRTSRRARQEEGDGDDSSVHSDSSASDSDNDQPMQCAPQ